MTTTEFEDQFDILYNNVMSNQAPGLNSYEKSVFLTKAQDEIVKAYFNPKTNKSQEGFDGSQKRQYDFSNLIRTASLFNINTYTERITALEKIDKRSQVFLFPENYFLSINEIIFDDKQMYSVLPLSYDEYQRLMLRPYALPVKRGAWRLFTDKKNCNYIQDYIKGTECDYELLTTWADQKRNIVLTVRADVESVSETTESISNKNIVFRYKSTTLDVMMKLQVAAGYSDEGDSYEIKLILKTNNIDTDDSDAVKFIKYAFEYLKANYKESMADYDTVKALVHLDGFTQVQFPSKYYNIASVDGKQFETHVISLPIAEIIGKFNGDITYQIRYLRRPQPIILTDLTQENVSIGGKQTVSECELSSELHQEILQRAVELAKAAYTGDLNSQIAVGNTSATNLGILTSNK